MALDKELQILLSNLQKLGVETREFEKRLLEAEKAGKSNVSIIAEMSRAMRDAEGSASGLYDTLRSITSELKSTNTTLGKATGAYDKLTEAAFQLRNDEQGINDLSRYNLEQLDEKIKKNLALLNLEAERLVNGDGLNAAQKEELQAMKELASESGNFNDNMLELMSSADTFTDKQKAILSSYYDQHASARELLTLNQNRLLEERKISKAMGVTGAVVQGTGAFMERLGMRSGIFNDAMKDAADTMRTQSKLIKGNVTFMNKLSVAAAGVNKLAKGFGAALRDPALIVGAITKGFSDLNKAGVEFGQTTGMAADAMSGVHTEVSTAVDMLKTATSVTKELGLNAAALFTPQQIGQISDMATLLGLSEQAAGRLGLMMKTTGQSADQLGESVYETVSGLNEAGRSAVAPRQVLDDVLTASEDIALSLGNNPDKLAAAATAARKFGMTLSQVDKIADSLLDFESSIEAELEAQLLTGKNLNMAKARELALNNDLAGLAKELEKQGVSAVEFSKMNRIQQEATAKALGMSRQELSKSLLTQEAQANMTDEQLAAARGVSLEESKRIGIQERIEKAIQKVQLAFAPVLEALVPIVEMALALINPFITAAGFVGKLLGSILKLQPVMLALKGLVLATFGFKFASYIKGVMLAGKSLQSLVIAQKSYNLVQKRGLDYSRNMTGAYSTAVKRAKEYKNMTIGQTIVLKAHNAAVLIADKIKKAYAATTDFLSKKIAAASAAIKSNTLVSKANDLVTTVGNKLRKLAVGTYNLLTTATMRQRIATIASTVAERAKTAVDKISVFLGKTRIGQIVKERALILAKTAATYLGIGATRAANLAATQSAAAGAAGGAGMAAFGAGLGTFGVAAAPAIPIILAIGAALLMASPAIYALGLIITGLAQVIGNVLMKALEMLPSIIASVATGFTMILSQITLEKAAALVVMGAGFAAIGYGLTVLSASLLTALPGLVMLGAIAALGPGLSLAGQGVKLIADNVSKLSEALQTLNLENLDRLEEFMTKSAFTMPIIAAAGPAAASAISTIAGAGGAGEEDNKVAAKIQELIDLVGSGQIVELKLDSDTISKQQMISLSKGK